MIAGVDEAGRGALAGPVVAGAVIFLTGFSDPSLMDSKQLSEKQREILYKKIVQKCDWGVGIVEAPEIDQIGIKKATEKAMNIAVQQLKKNPTKILVDGRDKFQFPVSSTDIIRGDETESVISAASIIAKVTRDELMKKSAKKYPVFQFDQNMGYGTESHRSLLEQEIYCDLHRKTYDPLKTVLTQGKLF